MDNNKAVAVKREWVEVALNIIRFFFQHSTFEYDGMNRKARVKYHGPNGSDSFSMLTNNRYS